MARSESLTMTEKCGGDQTRRSAIVVQNVTKCYSGGGSPVLRDISMNVERGTVYGFLGSSGCGKTTLLSCVLGLKPYQRGDIWVLGRKRGRRSLIQNRAVGYMPQEYALQDNLTPEEIVMCYGHLYGIPKEEVITRWANLSEMLGIAALRSRLITSLSGGQKRRVSLALALIHKPELLVLDEPTVGLDPLLRIRIWKHLYDMTSTGTVTVLVTTHYVSELRNSSTVGVMRYGRLIAETNPQVLMSTFDCTLLQDAVLKACRKDQCLYDSQGQGSSPTTPPKMDTNNKSQYYNNLFKSSWRMESILEFGISGSFNMKIDNNLEAGHALELLEESSHHNVNSQGIWNSFWKILTYAWFMAIGITRDKILIGIIILLPILQILTTLAVVGVPPKHLNFGVINNEQTNWTEECSPTLADGSYQLSCLLIEHLSKNEILNKVKFNSRQEAEAAVALGDLWGFVEIPEKYTNSLENRAAFRLFADNETIDNSTFSMRMDNSNFVVSYTIMANLYQSLFSFVDQVGRLRGLDVSAIRIPIEERLPPVYGSVNGSVRDYATPIVAILAPMEVSVVIGPLVLITEWKKRTLERSFVAGLTAIEALAGITLAVVPFCLVTSVITYLCIVYALGVDVLCSIVIYLVLCLITTFCGISFGFMVCLLIGNIIAGFIFLVICLPTIAFYMGLVCPMESVPKWLSMITYCFPLVPMAETMRSVMQRGLSLVHPTVWPGIGMTFAWILISYSLTILFRKKLND